MSGSSDGTLRVWDLKSAKSLRTLEGHTDWVTAVAVTGDGRRAVSGSWDNRLRLWDPERAECIATFVADGAVYCARIVGDGAFVAGDAAGSVHVLRLENV